MCSTASINAPLAIHPHLWDKARSRMLISDSQNGNSRSCLYLSVCIMNQSMSTPIYLDHICISIYSTQRKPAPGLLVQSSNTMMRTSIRKLASYCATAFLFLESQESNMSSGFKQEVEGYWKGSNRESWAK